jgi:hypothetical protein
VAAPAKLPAWLIDEGFTLDQMSRTKIVRSTHDLGPTPVVAPVVLLGPEQNEATGALNSIAWGDWAASSSVATWFGATVGVEGFWHRAAYSTATDWCRSE